MSLEPPPTNPVPGKITRGELRDAARVGRVGAYRPRAECVLLEQHLHDFTVTQTKRRKGEREERGGIRGGRVGGGGEEEEEEKEVKKDGEEG